MLASSLLAMEGTWRSTNRSSVGWIGRFSVFCSGSFLTGTGPGLADHEDCGWRVQFWLVVLLRFPSFRLKVQLVCSEPLRLFVCYSGWFCGFQRGAVCTVLISWTVFGSTDKSKLLVSKRTRSWNYGGLWVPADSARRRPKKTG